MNIKLFLFTFIFILLLVVTCVSAYTVTNSLLENFSFTEYSDGELKEFVYSIAPREYPLLSIELQGYGAYEPVFYLYDVEEEKIIYRADASYNEKIEYSFVPEAGKIKTIPKEYYLIILSNGKEGSSFDFSYTIQEQNDANLGGDAPKRFTDAEIMETGDYTANLGGGDEKDYYAFNIEQDETFTFTLQSLENERLSFELIESSYMTTISEVGPPEGYTRTFTSTMDQTIWIGISGNTAYTFSVQSDRKQEREVVEEVELPPTPPMPPEPEAKEIVVENQKKGLSTNALVLLFLIVVGALLFGVLFLRAQIVKRKKELEKKHTMKHSKK